MRIPDTKARATSGQDDDAVQAIFEDQLGLKRDVSAAPQGPLLTESVNSRCAGTDSS